MTKREADWQYKKLNDLTCYSAASLETLKDFIRMIRSLNSFLESAAEGKELKQQNGFSNQYLTESEMHIDIWLRRPNKSTLGSTFSEYRRDILDDFSKCIRFGDENDLWEKEKPVSV